MKTGHVGYTVVVTLVVDYGEFADAVKRYGEAEQCVMYKRVGDSVHLTYVCPNSGVLVVSFFVGSDEEAKRDLEAAGFCVTKGTWVTEASLEHLSQVVGDAYIVGVSYETRHGPGLWLDAFPTPPSEGTVLRAVFDEFVSEGQLGEDNFEEFLREARPQVRILAPNDIERFLEQKPRP